MTFKEKLELLVAFLLMHGKMNAARQIADVVESLDSGNYNSFIFCCKRLGMSGRDIRTLLWEVRSNCA